jgi:hypothetical protein
MANIAISDLRPVDFDLLSDSESYIRDISDAELNAQIGGIAPFWAGYFIGVAATGVATFLIGGIIDWLFD